MKINAVQQQVMIQGNITKEEEQAISSLCSIISHNDGLANYSPDNRMILKDVEIAPVYDGCEELSKDETILENDGSFTDADFCTSLKRLLRFLPELLIR